MAKFSIEKWESFISGVTLNIEMTACFEMKIEVADDEGKIPVSLIENLQELADEMEAINKNIENEE